jgi:thymidine kinase
VFQVAPHRGGWLEVVCGPMFSATSEELIRRLRRAEIAGQRALVVKPQLDDRYDVGHVVSHAGAKMRAVTADSSEAVQRLAFSYDAVGIDEAQFFDAGLVDAVDRLIENGTRVIVSGLRRTSAGSRSARCRRCCASRTSSTSYRRSAIAAGAPAR